VYIVLNKTVEVNEMKVKVVLNAKNVYCNADNLAEYFDELNCSTVRKLDDERVELVFDSVQLKRIYDEYYTLENFIRDAIAKCTEASVQFAYGVNLNDVVERVDVELKDVYFADAAIHAILVLEDLRRG
jgi:hypothetical protein